MVPQRTIPAIFTAVALTVVPMVAGATTVTVSQQNAGNVFYGTSSTSATITASPSPTAGNSVNAGAFAVKGDLDGDSSVDDFLAFCGDLAHFLALPATYTASSTPASGYLLAKVDQIQALFDSAYSSVLANVTNSAYSAGFQLALWEVIYENGATLNLSTGGFKANSSAVGQANSFLAGLDGWSGPKLYDLTFLEGSKSQFLITASAAATPPAIPLPGAVWLLGAGIAGLATASRRRKSA